MTRTTRSTRFVLAAVLATALAGATAHLAAANPAEPEVPTKIAVPEGHTLFLVGHAVGVQIYACNATSGGYRWDFVAPRANLYGDNGKLIVTHFAGPRWQAKDGSTALGTVVDRAPVEGAIPWLLLSTTATPGADGDRLAGTKYIQRIATWGGVAPAAADCTAATAGTITEVPYTSDYTFWKATGD